MHGAGNDFMVARWPDETSLPDAETVRHWADRRAGIGFDQLLLVRAAREPGLAAFYHVFNADGAEVQQCGKRRSLYRPLPDAGRNRGLVDAGAAAPARWRRGSRLAVKSA